MFAQLDAKAIRGGSLVTRETKGRARDSMHHREVAIKVLPERLARDEQKRT